MLNAEAISAELIPTPPCASEEVLHVKDVCHGFDKTQGELLVLDGANLSAARRRDRRPAGPARARASRRCCASSPA